MINFDVYRNNPTAAADKIEPGKEYTLTEIERLLRDSENEAEKG